MTRSPLLKWFALAALCLAAAFGLLAWLNPAPVALAELDGGTETAAPRSLERHDDAPANRSQPDPGRTRLASASASEPGDAPVFHESGYRTLVPAQLDSDGYAGWVRKLLVASHPAEAVEAVAVMNNCLRNIDVEGEIRDMLVTGARQPDFKREFLESHQRHLRRCQSLTPELYAQRQALAQRAVDAEWPGANRVLQDLLQPPMQSSREVHEQAMQQAFERLLAEQAQRR